jgi:hypothetical protein
MVDVFGFLTAGWVRKQKPEVRANGWKVPVAAGDQ